MPARTPEETHALLAAAFNSGDLDAFVDVYEEDAVLLAPPEGERVTGRGEIRCALESTFATRPRAEIRVVAKLQQNGLALTLGHWTLSGTDADGARVNMEGRGTIVSRRQPDGTWRIVLDLPVRPDWQE
jgi:uncharacterized protein (TIGR02246 family)